MTAPQTSTAGARQPQRPAAVFVDALMLVTPTELDRLTPAIWGDLGCALLAREDGRPDLAEAVVTRLEGRLGVHEAHRVALVNGEDVVTALIREAKEKRAKRQQDRAKVLNRGVTDRHISEDVEDMLRQASEHRAKAAALEAADQASAKAGRKRLNRAKVKDHLTAARRLEIQASNQTAADRDLRWLLGATAETVQLAQARGEDVEHEEIEVAFEVKDEHGAALRYKRGPKKGQKVLQYDRITRTVLRSRGGGIEIAYEKGHLDGRGAKAEVLKQTGIRYRECYEIIEAKVTNKGEGGGGYGAKAPQPRIAAAGQDLAAMRKHLTDRQRKVLDLVCGEDMRLRLAASHLKAGFPATQNALHAGLVVATDCLKHLHEGIKDGEVEDAVERVQRVNRELRKIRL